MTAHQFVEGWIKRNPTDCAAIVRAVLRAYCVDRDMNNPGLFINLEKKPDLADIDGAIVGAIRRTSFVKEAEKVESLWVGCSGLP